MSTISGSTRYFGQLSARVSSHASIACLGAYIPVEGLGFKEQQ